MKKIVIFAGTTEGRRLSEVLSESGIRHTVCVATEYGEIVMQEQTEPAARNGQPTVSIHRGRMDEEQMQVFLRDGAYDIVVDATHPYAKIVTENIRGAVASLSGETEIRYLRLQRKIDRKAQDVGDLSNLRYFETNEACAKALEMTEGNILLTTGSKELAVYCASGKLNDKLYVRILPGRESLELCMAQGIKGRQILALQGPFSVEMNLAILKQYDIRHLVTKNSGRVGGYREKLEAAERIGIPVYVIEPENAEANITKDSFSFEEICRELEQLCGGTLSSISETAELKISLAGIGMGGTDSMTTEVRQAIADADILLGADRMIRGYTPGIEKKPYYTAAQILPYLSQLQKENITADISDKIIRVVILFSGDTGFYSGCAKLYRALQEAVDTGEIRGQVRILPGLSAVAYLASREGVSYEDAAVLSMHGKRLYQLGTCVKQQEKTFLLTSGRKDIEEIGRILTEAELPDCKVTVGCQLSYPEEKLITLTPKQCMEQAEVSLEEGLYTCLIRNPQPQPGRLTHGRADACFLRDDPEGVGTLRRTPMTKEEVREVSICKLHLTQNAVVYDIGSGTGSVAIEIAGLSAGVNIYAIERKPEAVKLLYQNRQYFGMDNMQIYEAYAPEGLEDLPAPTHAFIGGSGGHLKEILETLYRKNPRMRVVINAISMETIAELKEALESFPVEEAEIVQMQVNRVKKIGNYHMPQAENPVWICSFTFCENVN